MSQNLSSAAVVIDASWIRSVGQYVLIRSKMICCVRMQYDHNWSISGDTICQDLFFRSDTITYVWTGLFRSSPRWRCQSVMIITVGVPDSGLCGTHMNIRSDALCLSLTSHQQLRSYGDGATAYSLIRRTDEAGDRTCDPWFTRQVTYPLHHSGSVLMLSSQTDTLCCDRIRLWSRYLSGSRSWIIKI